jgi:Holliday junction DNA helicase RuvA
MISYLKGEIILKKDLGKERFVVLDVAGVGYKVFLSKKTFTSLQNEKFSVQKQEDTRPSTILFCYLYVRENIMDLYGFANWEEREVFELLLGISGVGPKAAIEISALGPLEKLKKAIDAGDGKIFEGIPGIGKKRIAKILLELSGKIKGLGALARNGTVDEDPCVDALVNMGFSKTLARQALEQIPKSISEEDRIKEALKQLK